MDITTIAENIAVEDADIEMFVRLAIEDGAARDEIMRQMTENSFIMVYYHCYYVVARASAERPDLFYPYWDRMAALLDHANSYHRDIGLTVIANLTGADQEDRFSRLLPAYFAHIDDPKVTTARYCVQSAATILRSRPDLADRILDLLLRVDELSHHPEKQRALIKHDVLAILDEFGVLAEGDDRVKRFIEDAAASPSPKTRAAAKGIIKKHAW